MFNKIFLVLVALFAAFLFYYLPDTDKVRLIGTEVKRMDTGGGKTKDVRFIVASSLYDKETLMYRNEDIAWPPYFKFDSGDLSGHVMNLEETSPGQMALITHYGWRIPIFSMYPNATDIRIVEDSYKHIPWFNIFTISFITIFLVFLYFKLKKSNLVRKNYFK